MFGGIRGATLGVVATVGLVGGAHGAGPGDGQRAGTPTVVFHGQYRINSYVLAEDGEPEIFASRLRARPTVDATLPDDTWLHLQVNIGHITGNVGQARLAHDGGPGFGLRHAVIGRRWGEGLTVEAGLVPIADRFGDTLFSADWDFSPLALVFSGAAGELRWRAGAAQIVENSELWDDDDDVALVVGDVDYGPLGVSVYGLWLGEGTAATAAFDSGALIVGGARYHDALGPVDLRVNLLASALRASRGPADIDALGFAAVVEARLAATDRLEVGLLSVVSTGDRDFGGTGDTAAFLTPMSLLGTHGYWGYTGILNIQGPTDTGVDDPLNIDGGSYGDQNLGRGLLANQIMLRYVLADFVTASAALGLFRGMADGGLEGRDIGADIYLQLRWALGGDLHLETGVAAARLGPGHHAATSPDGSTVLLGFSRLQLEY